MPIVEGVTLGHWSDLDAATGCTVICLPDGTTAGVAVPGRAPATRETDALVPGRRVKFVHAIVLTGGSAYGLDAAGGVMHVLEAQGRGHETPAGLVPIVPAAAIFDLGIGDRTIRPGVEQGRLAAASASVARDEGLVGAATGATCGKYAGFEHMTKTGFGIASDRVGEVTIEAFAVCNAVGDIVDEAGRTLAGSRHPEALARRQMLVELLDDPEALLRAAGEATTIACVVTDAVLDGAACTALAEALAEAAFAQALAPPGTLWDGDALFVCATNRVEAPIPQRDGARVLAEAVRRCARTGREIAGVPAAPA